MSLIKIYTYKSKVLRKMSLPLAKITPQTRQFIDDMVDTLRSKPGLGLAAPQLGKSLRIIIIESRGLKDDDGNVVYEHIPLKILINPTILNTSKEKVEMEEGCFSVPNVFGPVVRPKKIKVTATDLQGKIIKINASGLLARIIQHENDHLNGIIFTDHIIDKKLLRKVEGEMSI